MKSKQPSLATATFDEICRFRRDNIDLKDFWLLSDPERGEVSIHKQRKGEPTEQEIQIPRHVFNHMVREYLKPRKFVRKQL